MKKQSSEKPIEEGGEVKMQKPDRKNAAWHKEAPDAGEYGMREAVRTFSQEQWTEGRDPSTPFTPHDRNVPAVLLAIFAVVAVGTLLAILRPWESRAGLRSEPPVASMYSDLDSEFQNLASEIVVGPLPQVVADSFTQTADPDERLRWCRDPDRVASLLPSFPTQAVSEIPISVEEMDSVRTMTLNFVRFVVTFKNGEKRLLCVVRTDEGSRVDWEAYARYSNALENWTKEIDELKAANDLFEKARTELVAAEELVAKHVKAMPEPSQVVLTAEQAKTAEKERLNQAWRVKLARDKEKVAREEFVNREEQAVVLQNTIAERVAEVRVFVTRVNYYNFHFSDSQSWRSYRISSPDLDKNYFGYAEVGSVTEEILAQAVITAGEYGQRMTLELRFEPRNAQHQQYQIDKVLATGWVEGEGEFEEAWSRTRRVNEEFGEALKR